MQYIQKHSIRRGCVITSRLAFTAGFALLAGCTALTVTTHRGYQVIDKTAHGITYVSGATTNASVTQPDTPRLVQAREFAHAQWPQLKREAARGGGEHVDALAVLLGDRGSKLGPWMQTHYRRLFKSDAASAGALIRDIDSQSG